MATAGRQRTTRDARSLPASTTTGSSFPIASPRENSSSNADLPVSLRWVLSAPGYRVDRNLEFVATECFAEIHAAAVRGANDREDALPGGPVEERCVNDDEESRGSIPRDGG